MKERTIIFNPEGTRYEQHLRRTVDPNWAKWLVVDAQNQNVLHGFSDLADAVASIV